MLAVGVESRGWIDGGKVPDADRGEKSFVFLRTQRVRLGIAVFRGDGTGPSGTAAGTRRTGAGRVLVGHGADVESQAIVAGVVPTMELAQRGRSAQGHGLPHVAAEEGHCADRLPGLLHSVSLLPGHQNVMQHASSPTGRSPTRTSPPSSPPVAHAGKSRTKTTTRLKQGLSSGAQLRPRQYISASRNLDKVDKTFIVKNVRLENLPKRPVWGVSSVGRAPEWHSGGREFDSPTLHHPEDFRIFAHKPQGSGNFTSRTGAGRARTFGDDFGERAATDDDEAGNARKPDFDGFSQESDGFLSAARAAQPPRRRSAELFRGSDTGAPNADALRATASLVGSLKSRFEPIFR